VKQDNDTMTVFKVLVPDAHQRDIEVERSISGDKIEYLVYRETDASAIPDAAWRICDAVLMVHNMPLTEAVIAKLDRCRLIVRAGVGYDNVDVAACRRRGIPVSNVPNYGSTEVADHALGMLLYLVRGLGTYQERLKADLAAGFSAANVPVVRRIRGSTFGAIGMGPIGMPTARRAAAFDMKVIYYDPYLPAGHELGIGVERVSSHQELLGRSDVVSLHLSLTDMTRNFIDKDALALMKQGSVLINVARGGLVDVDALHDSLKSGHLGAAALDVLPVEPPLPEPALIAAWRNDEPWIRGRFIVTPHAAFYSEAGVHDAQTFSAEILLDYLLHGRLRNNVNPGWEAQKQHERCRFLNSVSLVEIAA